MGTGEVRPGGRTNYTYERPAGSSGSADSLERQIQDRAGTSGSVALGAAGGVASSQQASQIGRDLLLGSTNNTADPDDLDFGSGAPPDFDFGSGAPPGDDDDGVGGTGGEDIELPGIPPYEEPESDPLAPNPLTTLPPLDGEEGKPTLIFPPSLLIA